MGRFELDIQSGDVKQPIFASHFKQLWNLGFAIIPCGGDDGKKPLVANFNKWKYRPGESQLFGWAKKHPDANIGALTGLSGVIVVDVDDRKDMDIAFDLFGETPLKTRTSRGGHLFYRSIADVPNSNLRPLGLEIDIKAGTSHVLLPPSCHASGAIYALDNCGWSDIGNIPPFQVDNLNELIAGTESPLSDSGFKAQRSTMQGVVTEGNRGIALNDRLCAQVGFCDSFDDLLSIACDENESFLPPLEDAEVVKRASAVWDDFESGKIKRSIGRPSNIRTTAGEISDFLAAGGKGDAWLLWQYLQTQHTARVRNGKTFSFVPDAMEMAQCLPGWTASKYRYQFEKLQSLNLIEKVRGLSKVKGKFLPCLYTFKIK